MKLKSIRDVRDISGKRVLLRVAYDVPLKRRGEHWVVADDRRLSETIPTIEYLLKKRCRIVLMSWLGRPNGKVVESQRMAPVAKRLEKLLRRRVKYVDDCVGPKVHRQLREMKSGEILMLENVRFYHDEERNGKLFSALLAHGYDLICFDAFAQAHRTAASTVGIAKYLPMYAGMLLEKELNALSIVSEKPKKPFVVILGGAKISDKLDVLRHLLSKAQRVLIGGGQANVFMAAKRVPIGKSLVEKKFVDKHSGRRENVIAMAKKMLSKRHNIIMLPVDFLAGSKPQANAQTEVIDVKSWHHIKPQWMFLDIGPKTVATYLAEIKKAGTIFFNGPMGMFEIDQFAFGTKKIAEAVARSKAITVLGGGDTEAVVARYGLDGKFTHVSTGGGAALAYLAGKRLPALEPMIQHKK